MKKETKHKILIAVGLTPIAIAVILYSVVLLYGEMYADETIIDMIDTVNKFSGGNLIPQLSYYQLFYEMYVNRNLILISIIGYSLVLFAFYFDSKRKQKGELHDVKKFKKDTNS